MVLTTKTRTGSRSRRKNIIFSSLVVFALSTFSYVPWFTRALKEIPTSDNVVTTANNKNDKAILYPSCHSPKSYNHRHDCDSPKHRHQQQKSPDDLNNSFRQQNQQDVVLLLSHIKEIIKILLSMLVISATFVYGLAHLPAFWIKPSYYSPSLSRSSSREIISSSNINSSSSSSSIPSYEQRLIQKGGPLHHFTYIGTHNSCHVANIFGSLFIPHWTYTHLHLVEQLDCGIRHVELDCWFNVTTEEWELWHEAIDPLVTPSIPLLRHVLHHDLRNWSIHHPGHFPLSINLDFKGAYHSKYKYISFMVAEKNHAVIRHAFSCLEKLILEVYKQNELFTPEDMRIMHLTSSLLSSTAEAVETTTATLDEKEDDDDSSNSNIDTNNNESICYKLLPSSSSSMLSRTSSTQSLRAMTSQYGWPDVRKLQNKTMFMLNLYGYKKMFRFDTAPQSVMFVRGQVCDGDYYDVLHQNSNNNNNKRSRDDVSSSKDTYSINNGTNRNEDRSKKQYAGTDNNDKFNVNNITASDHIYLEDNAGYEKTKDHLNQNPNSLLRVTLLGSGSKRGPKDLSNAKIKLDQLLNDGVHLVASNHPFHLATNMIQRNGLWSGVDDENDCKGES